MRRWKKRVLIAFGVLAVLGTAWYLREQSRYPYGWSHCCDKQLGMALNQYADKHDGWFPRGEATPEASLSLLYREKDLEVSANLLRGKIVQESVVKARLDTGELLTPETCGWHYVEGLRIDDDPQLALFWDKAGLGHNGEKLRDGSHDVIFLHGTTEYISAERWEQFLLDQEKLRAAIKRVN